MFPTELKLICLRHCFVHLPQSFLSKEQNLDLGAIICLRSVQTDKELFVTWDGQITDGNYAQIDLTFAQANGFSDELIIVSAERNKHSCIQGTLCRAELLDSSDYSILSQHQDVSLLDTCRLVRKDLVVPIWVSHGVHVLVRISSLQPYADFNILTTTTEMQFLHSSSDDSKKQHKSSDEDREDDEITAIEQPISLLSCAFSYNKPRFHLGSLLVIGERGSGKTHFLKTTIERYKKYHGTYLNCKQLRGKRPEAIKKRLLDLLEESLKKQPTIICFDDIDSFVASDPKHEDETGQEAVYNKRLVAIFCDLLKQIERSSHGIVIIASCRSAETLDKRISNPRGRSYFVEIIKLSSPNLDERITIFKSVIAQHQLEHDFTEDQFLILSKRCNSFSPFDIKQLVERAIIATCSRSLERFSTNSLEISYEDLDKSLHGYVPLNLRGVSLKPKTNRSFGDIGGMSDIKEKLLKTILLPLKYPNLYRKCPIKQMTSILLYGPPGCGKTLIAEALTNEESINSISVKGPELLSKYIGASEGAVRDLFRRAELAKPCVIFFDEFESLVAKRGSDSSGVTDRVVNQFLTMLDGVDRLSSNVFIIAATSRPDMIDPAMLRPGRLDRHIYCPLPNESDRGDILRILMRHIEFEDPDIKTTSEQVATWAERLVGFTGADIRAFLYSSQLKALHELIQFSTDSKSLTKNESSSLLTAEQIIKVKTSHLEDSFSEMLPEISARHQLLLKNYPKSMRRLNQQQISTRATLA